jgi:hypothetical protein
VLYNTAFTLTCYNNKSKATALIAAAAAAKANAASEGAAAVGSTMLAEKF